jgi:hypothetical protein
LPFSYLVPDARLLSPESIRFFYIDPAFTDRLFDGVMAAGSIGTLDQAFTASMIQSLRSLVDEHLGASQLTGFLLRSQAVCRFPTLGVRGVDGTGATLPVLRRDQLSQDTLIVIFGGVTHLVELQQPNEGTHFGLEKLAGVGYALTLCDDSGAIVPGSPAHGNFVNPPLNADGSTPSAARRVSISALRTAYSNAFAQTAGNKPTADSCRLALCLQRQPYVQQFGDPSLATTSTQTLAGGK